MKVSHDERYEREIEILEKELDEGALSDSEFKKELKELDRGFRAQREEDAMDAYDDIIERPF